MNPADKMDTTTLTSWQRREREGKRTKPGQPEANQVPDAIAGLGEPPKTPPVRPHAG